MTRCMCFPVAPQLLWFFPPSLPPLLDFSMYATRNSSLRKKKKRPSLLDSLSRRLMGLLLTLVPVDSTQLSRLSARTNVFVRSCSSVERISTPVGKRPKGICRPMRHTGRRHDARNTCILPIDSLSSEHGRNGRVQDKIRPGPAMYGRLI